MILLHMILDFDIVDDNINNDDDDNINILSNKENNNEIISYHILESNNKLDDDRIDYSSVMAICDYLFNSIKFNNWIKQYVARLMLEIKKIINSKTNKKIDIV